MHVKKLRTPEELERYVDFAREVYRDNPYLVPADKHHLIKLLSGNAEQTPTSASRMSQFVISGFAKKSPIPPTAVGGYLEFLPT